MKLKDITTDEIFEMTLAEVLAEINRDRSEEWIKYDETDYKEGLRHFTTLDIIEE